MSDGGLERAIAREKRRAIGTKVAAIGTTLAALLLLVMAVVVLCAVMIGGWLLLAGWVWSPA